MVWRAWRPRHPFPAVFSSVHRAGISGTCLQAIWHARNLTHLGYRVQVLGVSGTDVMEDEVDYVGAGSQERQLELIRSGRVGKPEVIFMDHDNPSAVPVFKDVWRDVPIVFVGHNIDDLHLNVSFQHFELVDAYAFVGAGQFARFCTQFPSLRHKFHLLRNCIPWETLYARMEQQPPRRQAIWIGAWRKRGLRRWGQVMHKLLLQYDDWRWILAGPSYGQQGTAAIPPWVFDGVALPQDRVDVVNLSLPELYQEISRSRFATVSLGDECCPVSTLDAHAAACPVISGNDVVYKYCNPEGTGIRAHSFEECYNAARHLIENSELCRTLGCHGRKLAVAEFTEQRQREEMERLLSYLDTQRSMGTIAWHRSPSGTTLLLEKWSDKFRRKWVGFRGSRLKCLFGGRR